MNYEDWLVNGFDWSNPVTDSSPSVVDSSGFSLSSLNLGSLLKGAGSALGAYGTIIKGNQIAGADEYNANLVLSMGDFKESQLDDTEDLVLGAQRAQYAKAGVTMSGSPLDTALNTATQVELDKQINRYNTQSKANMLNYEADVAKSQAKIKSGEQLLSGGISILTGLL